MDRLTRRQLAGTGAFLALAATATLLLSPGRVLDWLAGFEHRPLAFALALCGLYALRPLFAWPISPISALVGYVIGIPWAIPVALAGTVLTCLPPFLFARRFGDGGVFGRLGDAGQRVIEVTGATRGVLAARLSPLPADPVSYGAGFSGVGTGAFVAGTTVGEVPWVFVEVLAGASLRRLALDGAGMGFEVLAASFLLGVLVLAGPAYRHVRTRQPS
ncbi:MAG: TVP38/TMEM64 family protein [Haloarculaceae archaeon]